MSRANLPGPGDFWHQEPRWLADAELDRDPYIARLLASDEFRMDMCGDLGPVVLAALNSGDVAPLRAAIEAEAHSRLASFIDKRHPRWQPEVEAAEAFCRLFEKYDEMRRAKEAA